MFAFAQLWDSNVLSTQTSRPILTHSAARVKQTSAFGLSEGLGGDTLFNPRRVHKEGYNGYGEIWQREREA